MDAVTCLLNVRNNLRLNLVDPYTLTVPSGTRGTGLQFIYYDEPTPSPKYPIVEIKKLDNPTEIISINSQTSSYWEYEQVFANIFVYTKNGFSITVNGVTYKNSQLIDYYLGIIKTTLKGQLTTLDTAGVKLYKHLKTSQSGYDPNTQLYYGYVTIRVGFFIP